jgi:uncharacterized membrane protein
MTTTTSRAPAPAEPGQPPQPRRTWWWRLLHRWHYGFVGLLVAVTCFCLSLTPSLLPRGPGLQAAVGGISAAIGYGLGVLAVWLVGKLRNHPMRRPGRTAWRILAVGAAVAVLLFLYLGAGWQRDIHAMMGMDAPARSPYLLVLPLALLLAAGLVGLIRLLRHAAHGVGRLLGRVIPASTARVLAGLVVSLLAVGVLNGVVLDGFFTVTDNSFKAINGETEPDVSPPQDPLRSGGPGSLVSWASLGKQGRNFVTGGPSVEQLRGFSGVAAQRSIRVYAGLDSAPTSRERAALAVAELQRTGAFDREVLVVITTTGTGWVDQDGVDPLEFMYNGDSAMVGMQYSYLPSCCPSWSTRNAPGRPAGTCSTPCTAHGRSCH